MNRPRGTHVWLVVRTSKYAGSRIMFQGRVDRETLKAKRAFWRTQRDDYGFPFTTSVKN